MSGRLTRLAAATLAVGTASVCAPAAATVMVEASIPDLAAEAELVIVGRVASTGVYLRRAGGAIEAWTAATIVVEAWVDGAGPGELVVHEPGGRWSGGGTTVAGAPRYRVGERVLAFLRRDPDGRLRTVGMAQGRFVLQPARPGVPATAVRDLSGVGFLRAGGRAVAPPTPAPATAVDELLRAVREAVDRR